MTPKVSENEIREFIRRYYAELASGHSCCPTMSIYTQQCGSSTFSRDKLNDIPKGSSLGLGCGNPVSFASIRKGETIVDLGSGGGLDCFLASKRVGKKGKVIGVDMTPEMVKRAKENARKGKYSNVEFRLGEIENLPIEDDVADLVISNCVINLSTNKRRVFKEAYRVLKPGGRLVVSDIVLQDKLPEAIEESINAYARCVAGAVLREEYLAMIRDAGFENVRPVEEVSYPISYINLNDPILATVLKKLNISKEQALNSLHSSLKVLSITVYGQKPIYTNQ
ncbi:MAG: arsenite methyltransferase [Candidatus Bathyarchaeia archaeon]